MSAHHVRHVGHGGTLDGRPNGRNRNARFIRPPLELANMADMADMAKSILTASKFSRGHNRHFQLWCRAV